MDAARFCERPSGITVGFVKQVQNFTRKTRLKVMLLDFEASFACGILYVLGYAHYDAIDLLILSLLFLSTLLVSASVCTAYILQTGTENNRFLLNSHVHSCAALRHLQFCNTRM